MPLAISIFDCCSAAVDAKAIRYRPNRWRGSYQFAMNGEALQANAVKIIAVLCWLFGDSSLMSFTMLTRLSTVFNKHGLLRFIDRCVWMDKPSLLKPKNRSPYALLSSDQTRWDDGQSPFSNLKPVWGACVQGQVTCDDHQSTQFGLPTYDLIWAPNGDTPANLIMLYWTAIIFG